MAAAHAGKSSASMSEGITVDDAVRKQADRAQCLLRGVHPEEVPDEAGGAGVRERAEGAGGLQGLRGLCPCPPRRERLRHAAPARAHGWGVLLPPRPLGHERDGQLEHCLGRTGGSVLQAGSQSRGALAGAGPRSLVAVWTQDSAQQHHGPEAAF
eukprot:scaffold8586_cov239-Pinguiococcus_pyrenoidosus.AAC.1